MAEKLIKHGPTTCEAFVYEGERLGIEYPDGTVFEIPPSRIHLMLQKASLPDGEPCYTVPLKSPLSRLDIVVI